MTTSHTPGPWSVGDYEPELGHTVSIYANGPIAFAGVIDDIGTHMANAALMASAPELLDLLAAIIPLVTGYAGNDLADDHRAILNDARAEIRKARGQTMAPNA